MSNDPTSSGPEPDPGAVGPDEPSGAQRVDAFADQLRGLTEQPHASGWPDGSELRRRARRRHRRRIAVLGGSTTVAAIVVAVVLIAGSLGSRSTNYGASVKAVSVGHGALHLIDDAPVGPIAATSPATAAAVVGAETAFGLALTGQLDAEAPDANIVDSPLSADLALSMLELGAEGPTATGIADALQAGTLPASTQAAAWVDLQAALRSSNGPVTLQLANSSWLQKGDTFVPSYLAELAHSFGNAAYLSDFAGDSAAATDAINAWVAANTGGHIPVLFQPGDLSAYTVFVLANALNFSAAWADGINMSPTSETFSAAPGATESVPAIANESGGALPVAVTPGYTAVAVPYVGGRYQAIVIEPPAGTISQFVQHLDTGQLQTILGSLKTENVAFTMPSLKLAEQTDLNTVLTQLGMGQAFTDKADLSGISPQAASVSLVEQADNLVVNQYGTSFSAATGIVGVSSAAILEPSVTIDRPYLFLLQDKTTGAILADSVIHNPAGP